MDVAKPSFGPSLSVLTSVQTLAPAASPRMTAAWLLLYRDLLLRWTNSSSLCCTLHHSEHSLPSPNFSVCLWFPQCWHVLIPVLLSGLYNWYRMPGYLYVHVRFGALSNPHSKQAKLKLGERGWGRDWCWIPLQTSQELHWSWGMSKHGWGHISLG